MDLDRIRAAVLAAMDPIEGDQIRCQGLHALLDVRRIELHLEVAYVEGHQLITGIPKIDAGPIVGIDDSSRFVMHEDAIRRILDHGPETGLALT